MALLQRILGFRIRNSGRTAHMAMALVGVGAGLRLLAVPGQVGDVDSVNHASALAGFDPFSQAPHFPGYPVYTAVTQIFAAVGLSDVWALSLPGILMCAVALQALFVTLTRLLGARRAVFALGLCALAPGAVVVGAWPASDGFGFAMLLLSAALLLRPGARNALAGAVIAGLTLGTRMSYAAALLPLVIWPVVIRGSVDWREARRVGLGCLAGTLAWFIPMLCLLDVAALADLAVGFVAGHFSEFGGTATATGQGLRAGLWLRQIWGPVLGASGMGALWHGAGEASGPSLIEALGAALVALAALLCVAQLLRTSLQSVDARRQLWCVIALGLPYALWLALGQNPEKPRHTLPLLPLIGVGLGLGFAMVAGRSHNLSTAAVLIGMVAVSLPRAYQQHAIPVPAVALLQHLKKIPDSRKVLILAGPESRLLASAMPTLRVLRPLDMPVALREASRVAKLGVRPLLTTSIPGFGKRPSLSLVAAAEFPQEVRPQDAYLGLYEFQNSESGRGLPARVSRAAHGGAR